jgi:hypothetical protein
LAEALTTVVALEGFLLGVDIPVVSQMVLPPESFPTNVTGIRPLVCVSPLMYKKIVRFGKLSIAELADEPFLWPGRSARTSEEPGVIARVEGMVESSSAQPVPH